MEFEKNGVEPEERWKYQPWQDHLTFKYSLFFDTSHLYRCFLVKKAVQ